MSSIAENSALAADGLVMSQAALPHEVCRPQVIKTQLA
jgi:hypothetical protein